MANGPTLLEALQRFLDERQVDMDTLTLDAVVAAMLDWVRAEPADPSASGDALVYRYGGWSEGCATGYNLSLLRRITQKGADGKESSWVAGITMMYEPSGSADVPPFRTLSSEWETLDAFVVAIKASEGYTALRRRKPMGVHLESGALR